MDKRLLRFDKWQTFGDRARQPRSPGVVTQSRRDTKREALYRTSRAVSPPLRLVFTTYDADRWRTSCRIRLDLS